MYAPGTGTKTVELTILIKKVATITLTISPVETRCTSAGECVDTILTRSSILTRHVGTFIDVRCPNKKARITYY